MSHLSQDLSIYDLLYCEKDKDKIEKMVTLEFPDLVVSNAGDFIHKGRIAVSGNISSEEWFLWIMRNGLFHMSFMGQMAVMLDDEKVKSLAEKVFAEKLQADNNNNNDDNDDDNDDNRENENN